MATVLLVEDEMVIALGTSMVLEDADYTVVLAANGEVGLRKAHECKPDLIMTDYMMPRMDGLAMIRELRSQGFSVPIVLATSIPEEAIPSDIQELYDAYLGKPYFEDKLLALIQHLLVQQE